MTLCFLITVIFAVPRPSPRRISFWTKMGRTAHVSSFIFVCHAHHLLKTTKKTSLPGGYVQHKNLPQEEIVQQQETICVIVIVIF